MTRREILRKRLLPTGTSLADAPFEHHGLSSVEYEELCSLESSAAAAEWSKLQTGTPHMETLEISTSRANYGWRSLPSGTRFLGEQK